MFKIKLYALNMCRMLLKFRIILNKKMSYLPIGHNIKIKWFNYNNYRISLKIIKLRKYIIIAIIIIYLWLFFKKINKILM